MEETRFSHDGPLTVSIVDIGSNSVRMNIYAIDLAFDGFSVISSSRAMLRLAAHIDNGRLDADGEGKLFALIREYLAKSNSVPCDVFKAFATASLRSVSNAERVINRIYDKLGVKISVISGEDEAKYDYIATENHFGDTLAPRGVVVDMGGGSTEFVAYEKGEVRCIYSLPVGSLGLWRCFCGSRQSDPFPGTGERDDILKFVAAELEKAAPLKNFGGTAYLIGGTARALSNIDAALTGRTDETDGYMLDRAAFRKIADALVKDGESGADMIRKICPSRLTSIIPGALAYEKIIEYLGVGGAVISLAGVREGYIAEYIRSLSRK